MDIDDSTRDKIMNVKEESLNEIKVVRAKIKDVLFRTQFNRYFST